MGEVEERLKYKSPILSIHTCITTQSSWLKTVQSYRIWTQTWSRFLPQCRQKASEFLELSLWSWFLQIPCACATSKDIDAFGKIHLRARHYQASRSSHIAGKTPSVSLIVTCKWHFHVDVLEVQGSASKTFQKNNDSTVKKANASIPIGFSCGTRVHNKSKEHVLMLPLIWLWR